MNKDEQLLQKRLADLSAAADKRSIVTFSDFLNLNELNILHTTPKHLFPARYETFGGYEMSERQMVAFLPDALYYDYSYPINIVEICPLNKRYSETLSHRDYLGALMNLGIQRSKTGDILVAAERTLLFVKTELAAFIAQQLTRIGHTSVQAVVKELEEVSCHPEFLQLKGTVASIRLDTVLSVAYPLSRSKLTDYIEGKKVFVNGKQITSNGYRLKETDIISVRGIGRISYQGILAETKKGRYMIQVHKYI